MKTKLSLFAICTLCFIVTFAQPDRWQQRVKYIMNIDMNVQTNQFTGKQTLEYSNNSPDTLTRVYYHLYFNAFQPNSMMDTRSRILGQIFFGNRQDWDSRIKDRILNLKPQEIGYHKILSLKMNGRQQQFVMQETILEVKLDRPILPKTKAVFEMEFESQVPLQIRRSGRDNPGTKVRYSMSQWYPKICEYDYEGWHPTPYVAREFYGVWGDFDVTINIDKSYMLGGTGYLQNADKIGFGYEKPGTKIPSISGNKIAWHFIAPNVHDFMWAADPEFIHISRKIRDSLTIHVLYKETNETAKNWKGLLDLAEQAFPYIEKTFGTYVYKQYSFIHGGDGGMEYPMATLLSDSKGAIHELMHSWYQGMLATNETTNPWMDEGFAEYATQRVWAFLNASPGFTQTKNYDSYFNIERSGHEEALSTPGDHYNTNAAYKNVYFKGAVFVEQLGYIVGAEIRDKILLEYYRLWRFKHPNVNDFIRVAEKVSDMKLDWYREYWINTTKTIDYGIDSLWEEGGKTKIRIRRIGDVPMPIDFQLTFKDGTKELHYVPMYLMFGEKPAEDAAISRKVYEPWKWTHPTYVIESSRKLTDISVGEIDPSQRLADVERRNNKIDLNAIK